MCVGFWFSVSSGRQGRSQHGPMVLSRDIWEEWRMSGAIAGSTMEEVGNSLYQPITMAPSASSSRRIRATPMKHFRSIRP